MKRAAILCICLLPMVAQAETFGRLFHTPEQRAMLDLARKSNALGTPSEPDTANGQGLSVTGLVTRSDGRRSTWVNGRVQHDTSTRTQAQNQVWVKLPSGDVKLKVGQSLDPATGQVAEGYRRAPPPEPAAKPTPPKAASKFLPATPAPNDRADPDPPPAQ